MKQNPTIPAVLTEACGALRNITAVNPENKAIAGEAGAVQVHISASSYPATKRKNIFPRTAMHPTPLLCSTFLPMVLLPLPMDLNPYICCSTPLYGTPPPSLVVFPTHVFTLTRP